MRYGPTWPTWVKPYLLYVTTKIIILLLSLKNLDHQHQNPTQPNPTQNPMKETKNKLNYLTYDVVSFILKKIITNNKKILKQNQLNN